MDISKKDLEQNSVLIADFLGLQKSEYNKCYLMNCDDPVLEMHMFHEFMTASVFDEETQKNYYCVNINQFRYHLSYDWLMTVIEHIISLGYHVKIDTNYCQIFKLKLSILVGNKTNNRKEMIYNAIIEFITWYNKNK